MISPAAIVKYSVSFGFVFSSYLAFCQSYETSTQDVQEKMDYNKQNGGDLLQGIAISYELFFSGVNSVSDSQNLQDLLISKIDAGAMNYNPKNKTFSFECSANISLEQVKNALNGTNFEINGIQKAVYVLANY